MELPPLHNSRVPAQWEIISKHVDFAGKTVLDLGCGYADILFRCKEAGARECIGVDSRVWNKALARAQSWLFEDIGFADFDIDRDIDQIPQGPIKQADLRSWNVIICFSVLPYLDKAAAVLDWVKAHSEITLIECQYDGDGPGSVPWLSRRLGPDLYEYQKPPKDDYRMRDILAGVGWQSVEPIGKTLVEGRNKWRTIWLCR